MDLLKYKYQKCHYLSSYKPVSVPTLNCLKDAVRLINNAKKPFIVFGQGVLLGNAENEFKQFLYGKLKHPNTFLYDTKNMKPKKTIRKTKQVIPTKFYTKN